MADKKSVKKRRKGGTGEDGEGPNKDETEVAKHLRFNIETKKATMYGDEVFYFTGSKAVDFLLDSKWASGEKKSTVSFTHRDSVSSFLTRLLNYGLFNRVHLIKTEKKVKQKEGDKKKEEKKDEKKTEENVEKEKEKNPPGTPKAKKDKDGKETKKVKKKVKTTLEPHESQIFFDNDEEYYVWIYDPISWKTFILGILLVIAIIAICLFPLWPENIREYSWYLSVAGAIFVGAILVLAVLRYIIYAFLWLFTMGKLHFWLLPNLTAECGFFESFVPLYEYETRNGDKTNKKDKKAKKQRKSNDDLTKEEGENDEKFADLPRNVGKENAENEIEEKLQNDSEESNNSLKDEEGWVKVHRDDADGDERLKNEDQTSSVNC